MKSSFSTWPHMATANPYNRLLWFTRKGLGFDGFAILLGLGFRVVLQVVPRSRGS